jgi:hypothetical protein
VLREVNGSRFQSQEEHRFFQLYVTNTAEHLSGFYSPTLCNQIALQASEADESIRHAVISIGALDMTAVSGQKRTKSNLSKKMEDRHVFPLSQYSKAINCLWQKVLNTNYDLRTAMQACWKRCRQCLRMSRRRGGTLIWWADRRCILRVRVGRCMLPVSRRRRLSLTPTLYSATPSKPSLSYFDAVVPYTTEFLKLGTQKFEEAERWMKAFRPLLDEKRKMRGSKECLAVLAQRMQYLVTYIALSSMGTMIETTYDKYHDLFR